MTQGRSYWTIVLGFVSLALGIAGLWMTPRITSGSGLWFGALFIVVGIGIILEAVISKHRPQRGIRIWLGVIYLAGGLLMASRPLDAVAVSLLIAVIAFTMLIGALLVVLGLTRMIWAFALSGFARWLGVGGGIGSTLLGLIILMQWPVSGLFVICLFVAIDLILFGVMAIALGFESRTGNRSSAAA
jgi:uncharacterized membrane protein HdeD (DUF308 family)